MNEQREPSSGGGVQPELLTTADLERLTQMSGKHLRELVKANRFPAPVRLSSRPRWRRSDVMNFIQNLGVE